MCTITKEKPILQTAEEDIIVYKRCFKDTNDPTIAKSIIYSQIYNLNKVCKTELEDFSPCLTYFFASGGGFYSYENPYFCVNCKFIIPKGSKYYLAKDYEYNEYIFHSEQIKFVVF